MPSSCDARATGKDFGAKRHRSGAPLRCRTALSGLTSPAGGPLDRAQQNVHSADEHNAMRRAFHNRQAGPQCSDV